MTIKISELSSLPTVLGNVLIPMVANVAGTLTTVRGNVAQLTDYVLGTSGVDYANIVANAGSQAESITNIESNIAIIVANVDVLSDDIANLTANAGSQAESITNIESNIDTVVNIVVSNVNVLSNDIANLTANAGSQAESITNIESNIAIIVANVDVLEGTVANVISNAGSQAESITNIESNIAIIVANVDVLEGTVANVISNVSVITNDIEEIDQLVANIQSNVESQQEQINSLGIFEIAQVESNISILFSVVGTQTGQINELESNAAIQAGQIDELFANAASQATLISSLGDITELENNVETLINQFNAIGEVGDQLEENDEIIFGNIASLTNSVSTLTSTVSENSSQISNLQINVTAQSSLISNVAADIVTANIEMKGYVDEQITSNVSAIINGAPESLNTLNKIAEALGNDANLSVTINNKITAIEGNVGILFANAASQQGNIFILQSGVGSLTANAVTQQTAINGLVSNVATLTSNISNLSNVAISGDYDDLINTPNLAAVGDFVMGNVEHWTSNVFTFEEAVNQLAERIYNIENNIEN